MLHRTLPGETIHVGLLQRAILNPHALLDPLPCALPFLNPTPKQKPLGAFARLRPLGVHPPRYHGRLCTQGGGHTNLTNHSQACC